MKPAPGPYPYHRPDRHPKPFRSHLFNSGRHGLSHTQPQSMAETLAGKRQLRAALIVTTLLFITGFSDRFSVWTNGTLDSNIAGRFAIWTAATNMATMHPLTGFGLGTFHLYYPGNLPERR